MSALKNILKSLLSISLLLLFSCDNNDLMLEVVKGWETEIGTADAERLSPIYTADFILVPYRYIGGEAIMEIFDRESGESLAKVDVGPGNCRFIKDKFAEENKLLCLQNDVLYYFDLTTRKKEKFSDKGIIWDTWVTDEYYFYTDFRGAEDKYYVYAPLGSLDTTVIKVLPRYENFGLLSIQGACLENNTEGVPILYSIFHKSYSQTSFNDTLFVEAMNFETGQLIWEHEFNTNFIYHSAGRPQVTSNAVVVPLENGVRGLNKLTGEILYEFESDLEIENRWSRTMTSGETVLFWDSNIKLQAFNGNTGNTDWTRRGVEWPNVAVDSEIYFHINSSGESFQCRSISNDALLFEIQLAEDPGPTDSRFTVDGQMGDIYLNDRRNLIHYQFDR